MAKTTGEILAMITVDSKGYRQGPTEAYDAGGAAEIALQLNVQNVTHGGGSMTVRLAHALRNRAADYTELVSWTGITTATSSFRYDSQFYRFLMTKVEWSGAGANSQADVELLGLTKK